jgi:hypothetical protein
VSELEAVVADLQARLEVAGQEQADQQARNAEAFEEQIEEMIEIGANDREEAIRWMLDAIPDSDHGYLEYAMGLPYGYLQNNQHHCVA